MLTQSAWRLIGPTACLLLLAGTSVDAQTTYRWVDPATGHTVVSDRPPPPGSKSVGKATTTADGEEPLEARLPYAIRQASEKFPVTLYTSRGCTTCREARALLESRGVPFSEKEVTTEEEVAEIGRRVGGDLLLPSVSVGRQSVNGFAPGAWNDLLDAAGYPTRATARVRPAAKSAP
ncbi:DUF4124 domain-containing protein [Accumulibacter sp.]|uniref:DUF4124 domain-containing protein n=1 Tax=Accumulibacter sp. TaxID=2053492 RepID=UPI00260A89BE|nr:DUF4124 domain-containing protein [Accumulibacter sp.]